MNKYIITVRYGDIETYEKLIGVLASSKDDLCIRIFDALAKSVGHLMKEVEDHDRRHMLTPEKRKKSIYRRPWEFEMDYEGQKFMLTSEFSCHDVKSLEEFFNSVKA